MAGTRCSEELVEVVTADGVLLDGACLMPAAATPQRAALLFVHGAAGNFYSPLALRVGRDLALRGHPFVTVNTRGHDGGAFLSLTGGTDPGTPASASPRGGAWWEILADCVLDLTAWIDFMAARAFSPVILFGHSLGVVKAVHYLAARQDPRIAGLVAASAPAGGWPDPARLPLARQMIAEGRGRDLMPWETPHWPSPSAQTFVDRCESDLDVLGLAGGSDPLIRSCSGPILVMYGDREGDLPPPLDFAERVRAQAPQVTCLTIPGADHGYTGCEGAVAAAVTRWAEAEF